MNRRRKVTSSDTRIGLHGARSRIKPYSALSGVHIVPLFIKIVQLCRRNTFPHNQCLKALPIHSNMTTPARRTRTGCKTCRQRKLKCDEVCRCPPRRMAASHEIHIDQTQIKPVCGQCRKSNRECQPSEGLITVVVAEEKSTYSE